MSLGLIKPGRPAAVRFPAKHSLAGQVIEPLGVLPSGKVVWPVAGGAPDDTDPDDPTFTGEDEEDEDQDDDEEDENDKKSSKSRKSTSKKSKAGDDDDEDDDEDDKPSRPERQAARYRVRLRESERQNAEMRARLKALEDKDKKPDEIQTRDLTDAQATVAKLTEKNAEMSAQIAFFTSNTITWADPSDAFALAQREGLFEDVIDEDGNVDARELRRGLRDLAKRKPHLVKKDEDDPKARGRKSKDTDEDDEEDEDEQRSSRPMNGNRRGRKGTTPTRAELAKKFPVLQGR